jgi:hypothetical protein
MLKSSTPNDVGGGTMIQQNFFNNPDVKEINLWITAIPSIRG